MFRVLQRGVHRPQAERGGDVGHDQHPEVPRHAGGQRPDHPLCGGAPGPQAGLLPGEEDHTLRLLWVLSPAVLHQFRSELFYGISFRSYFANSIAAIYHFPVLKPRSLDQSWDIWLFCVERRLQKTPEFQSRTWVFWSRQRVKVEKWL